MYQWIAVLVTYFATYLYAAELAAPPGVQWGWAVAMGVVIAAMVELAKRGRD